MVLGCDLVPVRVEYPVGPPAPAAAAPPDASAPAIGLAPVRDVRERDSVIGPSVFHFTLDAAAADHLAQSIASTVTGFGFRVVRVESVVPGRPLASAAEKVIVPTISLLAVSSPLVPGETSTSKASFAVEVYDRRGKVVYARCYDGSETRPRDLATPRNIGELLAAAADAALRDLSNDLALRDALRP